MKIVYKQDLDSSIASESVDVVDNVSVQSVQEASEKEGEAVVGPPNGDRDLGPNVAPVENGC